MKPFDDAVQKAFNDTEKIKDAEEKEKERNKRIQEACDRFKTQLEERQKLYQTLSKFERPYHYHGHVWVYLRKPADATSAR
jgi:hypothetical protein